MENIWRFYNGQVSGIVIAESEEKAKEMASYYVLTRFDHNPEWSMGEMLVWRAVDDDDFLSYPQALAVSY